MPLWRGPAPVDLPPRDLALAPLALPEGRALRIVAFGTSLSARGVWPDRLAERLQSCLGRPVEVARVALPGAGSAWAADPARIAAVAGFHPDLVLVEFAINDADLRDGATRSASDRSTRAALAALQAALPDAGIVELTMSPAHRARGVLRPGLAARYDDAVRRGSDRGGGLVDLYRRWIALPRGARGLDADGLHPDPEIAAQVIVSPLAAYVAASFGQDCPDP